MNIDYSYYINIFYGAVVMLDGGVAEDQNPVGGPGNVMG